MKTFTLIGDITQPGQVEVEAETLDEAVKKASEGNFKIVSTTKAGQTFEWNNEEDSVEPNIGEDEDGMRCPFCNKRNTERLQDGSNECFNCGLTFAAKK